MSHRDHVVHLVEDGRPRCGAPSFHHTTQEHSEVTCTNCVRAAGLDPDMTVRLPTLREEPRTGTDD